MTDDFVSFDVFPGDVSEAAPAPDPAEQNAKPPAQPITEKEREQLQAYKNCFELLEHELCAIDERHKNDAQPEDSEATKELKAVRKELQDLKDALAMQAKQQQSAPQPMPQQPAFQMPPPPQMMYSSPFGSGFSVPYMSTPNFQPTIPNMTNFKQ